MTLISPRKAVLFGGSAGNLKAIDDCWILDVEKIRTGSFEEPSSLWKQYPLMEGEARWLHSGVLEPVSKRLWILGGFTWTYSKYTRPSEMLSISFPSVTSLRFLAMEKVMENFGPIGDEEIEIPKQLKIELENRRAHMRVERRIDMRKDRGEIEKK